MCVGSVLPADELPALVSGGDGALDDVRLGETPARRLRTESFRDLLDVEGGGV